MTRVVVVGPGRAGRSLQLALARAGWPEPVLLGRGDELGAAGRAADLLLLATPDRAVAEVAARIEPRDDVVVAHLSGSLGLGVLGDHPHRGVLHPLVALPDPDRGAERLVGAWYGVAEAGHPRVLEVVAALAGRAVPVAEGHWARYHAAASMAANHLVALLGQVERVAASVDVPLGAYLDLARGALEDVVALGPAAALTGPVRRGDHDTVARHRAALDPADLPAYDALAEEAARLCP